MNPNIENLRNYLVDHNSDSVESVLEQLYVYYKECYAVDSAEIRKEFAGLDRILSRLTLEECDAVGDITCRLCDEYEREAFLEGVKTGARLMRELEEKAQRTL